MVKINFNLTHILSRNAPAAAVASEELKERFRAKMEAAGQKSGTGFSTLDKAMQMAGLSGDSGGGGGAGGSSGQQRHMTSKEFIDEKAKQGEQFMRDRENQKKVEQGQQTDSSSSGGGTPTTPNLDGMSDRDA